MTVTREELAKKGALVTPRAELGPIIPAARREKFGVEVRGFFDTSDSTRWEARAGGPEWNPATKTGGRREPMLIAYRAATGKLGEMDSKMAAEQASGDKSKGGTLTFGFSSGSTKGHDVNEANFDEIFDRDDMQPGGGTHIADALTQADDEFDEEYGDDPPEKQPIKLDLIVTDGELDDLDAAEGFIRTADRKHVMLVMVFGYNEPGGGERHTRALVQWGKIAQQLKDADEYNHQYLFVVPFDDTTNPDDVVRDVQLAVS